MTVSKEKILRKIETQGFIPLFYHDDPAACQSVIKACFEGGCTVIEFTNRGERALSIFRKLIDFSRSLSSDIVLGVGTILDSDAASEFLNAGADFVVGPSFDEAIANYCNDQNTVYVPGCATLNEILKAEKAGMRLIKVFPAVCLGGPEFIKALRGPCPWLRLLPTGGVSDDPEELKEWFKAGAVAVGLGSNVISKSRIDAGDFASITESVRRVSDVIDAFRNDMAPLH